ncbi:hypothetical protein R3P38DRAFT_2803935 [Favolaschia claudopus]|uniref:Uncharacterized protein n=1 Tax=Favolaschia claudopus TaxID=2862362 RepID=A0AAV9ZRE3_9AGAR
MSWRSASVPLRDATGAQRHGWRRLNEVEGRKKDVVGMGRRCHCIIGNILGHAIFILAQPDKYFATFHSVVLSSLWGGLVVGGAITFATMLFGLCCLLVTREKMSDLLFFVVTLTWALEAASLLLAVVANVVGVCILRKRGYGSPLPTLADAAKVARIEEGEALMMNEIDCEEYS